MKKFTSVLFILLVSFCFILTGCSGSSLKMPENYSNVNSNGGFVVNVGDYMYFANAYQSYKNLETKSDNDGKGVAQYNINRAKTQNVGGNQSFVTDENNNVNFENVANKIAGYETSNMFVVNEYLYFTSPNVHKNDSKEEDKYQQYQFELTSLFRIKLDGSGLKELYTTDSQTNAFYLANVASKKVLIIRDDKKLLKVDLSNNSKDVTTIAENVSDVKFPETQEKELVNLYYIAEVTEGDNTTKVLHKYNFETNQNSAVSGYAYKELTLIAFTGDRLFYTRKDNTVESIYSNDFSNDSDSELFHKYTTTGLDAKIYLNQITNQEFDLNVIVYQYNNQIHIQNLNAQNNDDYSVIVAEKATISFVDGVYVYYTTDAGIYRVSAVGQNKVETIAEIENFDKTQIDFDGRYIYFFAEVENADSKTKYLYQADTIAQGTQNVSRIAELLQSDVESIENAESEE